MSNLVQELGSNYVREFFQNAVFVHNGRLHRFQDTNDTIVTTQSFDLSSKTPPLRWSNASPSLPVAALTDFSVFKHPKLGYRQIDDPVFGKLVVHLTGHRSTQRGFRPETCKATWLPIYDLFPDQNGRWESTSHCQQSKIIFVPEFTPYAEGIQRLIAGEWLGFAMNEDVAIGMSVHREENRGFDIYFRGRVVGNVGLDGNASIASSILKRDSIKSKMFK